MSDVRADTRAPWTLDDGAKGESSENSRGANSPKEQVPCLKLDAQIPNLVVAEYGEVNPTPSLESDSQRR